VGRGRFENATSGAPSRDAAIIMAAIEPDEARLSDRGRIAASGGSLRRNARRILAYIALRAPRRAPWLPVPSTEK
jgi:hypothetical protein